METAGKAVHGMGLDKLMTVLRDQMDVLGLDDSSILAENAPPILTNLKTTLLTAHPMPHPQPQSQIP